MRGECIERLVEAGIEYGDAEQLRRIAMTLHRWHELECGDGDEHGSWCLVRGKKDSGGAFEYDDNGHPPISNITATAVTRHAIRW